ncbi:hypothetical protein GQ55_5G432100 [Panicum hallii var. hallii]|nr:hypothetical protein GQ55_5G432100 [Panicum hallii var. hallii]
MQENKRGIPAHERRKQGMIRRSWARNPPKRLKATTPPRLHCAFANRAPVLFPSQQCAFAGCSRRRAPAAAFPIARSAMSRGTRVSGDVMGNIPEWAQRVKFPQEINFPDDFNPGNGRILTLNNRLRLTYEDIGFTQNKINGAYDKQQRATLLQGRISYEVSMAIYQREIRDNEDSMPFLATQAKCLIAEVIAVGGEPFVAGFVRQFLDKVPDAVTLPNGSLSYLCNRPHYFPDEIPVPQGLPAVSVFWGKDPVSAAQCNRFLQIRYSALARNVNRIRYFRDHRLRLEVDAQATVAGNDLTSKIQSCSTMLAKVVQVIHKREQLYGSQIFRMPAALRDKILEDPSIVNQGQLPDIDCLLSLYPQGIPQNSPIHHGRAVFLLFESAMGYSLFWAYNTLSPADLLSFESFTSVVKLIVHYPFATQAIAIQQFQHINNDTCSAMLRLFLELHLPQLTEWGWNSYRLGVRNRRFGQSIETATGIPCRRKKHSVKELRAGIEQFLHLFLEIEQAQLTEAQQDLQSKLEGDNPQQ